LSFIGFVRASGISYFCDISDTEWSQMAGAASWIC
jgi:hypothetical protein